MNPGSRSEEGKDQAKAKPIIWVGMPMAETPSVPPAELGGGKLYSSGIEPSNRVQESLPLRMEVVPKQTVLAYEMA